MKTYLLPFIAFALVAAPCRGGRAEEPERLPDLSLYLPQAGELGGWSAFDEPQTARGQDLYLLIDGAAEIFLEYGFKQAIFHSYDGEENRSINLEIYEMDDPASAFGIYTFRTSEDGGDIAIGNGARIEDYYINFWKGNFLVTVIGFDTDRKTINGVKKMAKAVAARIEEGGERPRLANALLAAGLRPNGIEYLEGNLALFNSYEFAKANIFGLSEGVIGMYGYHTIFLFYYEDESESKKWFLNGSGHIENSPRFENFTGNEDGCMMTDLSGNYLIIESYRNFIIVVLGTEKGANLLMTEQKAGIDRYLRQDR